MDSFINNHYYFSVTIDGNNIRRDQKLDWQSNFSTAVSLGQETFRDLYLYLELYNESGLIKTREISRPWIFQFNLKLIRRQDLISEHLLD